MGAQTPQQPLLRRLGLRIGHGALLRHSARQRGREAQARSQARAQATGSTMDRHNTLARGQFVVEGEEVRYCGGESTLGIEISRGNFAILPLLQSPHCCWIADGGTKMFRNRHSSKRKCLARSQSRKPFLEQLESRCLMAGDAFTLTISSSATNAKPDDEVTISASFGLMFTEDFINLSGRLVLSRDSQITVDDYGLSQIGFALPGTYLNTFSVNATLPGSSNSIWKQLRNVLHRFHIGREQLRCRRQRIEQFEPRTWDRYRCYSSCPSVSAWQREP